MTISAPQKPRWLPKEARRGYLNMKRQDLARKHGYKKWTYKGVLTRMFGQGIQRVFKALPALSTAAISGSMGVAAYDMLQEKRDLNWKPKDVDVFIAIPPNQQHIPLKKMYAIMTKWLRSVRDQGFRYELKKDGVCYSNLMCIFDFECTNAEQFPQLHLPKISFIGQPAKTVREICQQFDIPICASILRRTNKTSPIEPRITYEMRRLYRERAFYSHVRPTVATRRGRRTLRRVVKYENREFDFFDIDYNRHPRAVYRAVFPRFPFRIYRARKPTSRRFIIKLLGREPTKQECADFNIRV